MGVIYQGYIVGGVDLGLKEFKTETLVVFLIGLYKLVTFKELVSED